MTAEKWTDWLSEQSTADVPRSRFFLNGEKAPFWDSCALTRPPIFIQDKQGVVSRQLLANGHRAQATKWTEVETELTKCKVAGSEQPLFLFCTDAAILDRPSPLPDGVILVDHCAQAALFGPLLASRKAMCLSELAAAAPI